VNQQRVSADETLNYFGMFSGYRSHVHLRLRAGGSHTLCSKFSVRIGVLEESIEFRQKIKCHSYQKIAVATDRSSMHIQSTLSIILSIASIIIAILSILVMHKCLSMITPQNRALPTWSVWICLVPVIGFFWTLIVIAKIAKSLRFENFYRSIKIRRIEISEMAGITSVCFSLLIFVIPHQKAILATCACFLWICYLICLCFQIRELKYSKT
jgi:hypothetical protein